MKAKNPINAQHFFQGTVAPFLEESGMNVPEFARAIGLSDCSVYLWRSGRRHIASTKRDRVLQFIRNWRRTKNCFTSTPVSEADNMQLPTTTIKDIVSSYIRKHRITHKDFGELVGGLSQTTISNFISGRSNPHRETVEIISSYLTKEGELMQKIGLPTDLGKPLPPAKPVVPDEVDKKALEEMGIKGQPVVTQASPITDEWQQLLLINAIMSSHDGGMDSGMKRRLIGKLFPNLFPQCSKHA